MKQAVQHLDPAGEAGGEAAVQHLPAVVVALVVVVEQSSQNLALVMVVASVWCADMASALGEKASAQAVQHCWAVQQPPVDVAA